MTTRKRGISSFKAALAHPSPEVVEAFIREAAMHYRRLGSHAAVAEHYGCHRNVITESLAHHPALREAFDAVAVDPRAVAKRESRRA